MNNLTNLVELKLVAIKCNSVDFKGLSNIRILELKQFNLRHIYNLETLINLNSLVIDNCPVKRLQVLETAVFPSLSCLVLRHLSVRSLNASAQPSLERITASDCQLHEFFPSACCSRLDVSANECVVQLYLKNVRNLVQLNVSDCAVERLVLPNSLQSLEFRLLKLQEFRKMQARQVFGHTARYVHCNKHI